MYSSHVTNSDGQTNSNASAHVNKSSQCSGFVAIYLCIDY